MRSFIVRNIIMSVLINMVLNVLNMIRFSSILDITWAGDQKMMKNKLIDRNEL